MLDKTEYTTDKIIVHKGIHWVYEVNRLDQIVIYADYEHYRLLGLLIFAAIFGNKSKDYRLKLSNPKSEVKEIRIRNEVESLDTPGLHLKPTAFEYYPVKVERFPLSDLQDISRYDLPRLELNNEEEQIIREEDLKDRDILIIKGNYSGNAQLAEMILNFSYEEQEVEETLLETDLGFGGVAPGSAELRLFSPKVKWFVKP